MICEKYAAGFIDGEGCIRASRNIRVIVAGCFDPAILFAFQERWGGNLSAHKARRPNQRNGMRWEVTGFKAASMLRDVLPYLIDKKAQAELAIGYDRLKRLIGCRGGKGHNAEDKRKFQEIETKLAELKRIQHCV